MKSLLKFLCCLFVQVIVLSSPVGLQAQVDPSIEWLQIETDSAYWLFDARHQEAAKHYIQQFERAKREVLPLFKEESRKMTFVLLDNTDLANGSARVTPHPIVSLNAVQPLSYSAIGEFRDYSHELLVHEYTHILNMEPVHGWIRPMYWIFGSVAHPNMMLPRWYTEGLAVYTESAISQKGGRLNSQYLGGLVRGLTLENKWSDYPLSHLNDWHPDWIGGSRAYLFGGILWESMAHKNIDVIYRLNQSYSRRVPFLVHGPLESFLGVDYDEQLENAYHRWSNKAQAQLDKIKTKPHLNGEKLLNQDPKTRVVSSHISPDGAHVALIINDLDGQGHVYLTQKQVRPKSLSIQSKVKIADNARAINVTWHPTSNGFIFEKLDRFERFYNYYDLYHYDLKTKQTSRITRGQRAHQSCFSDDGQTLYFLTNNANRKNIVKFNWETKKTQVLYQGKHNESLNSLVCFKKQKLALRVQNSGKPAVLQIFNTNSKTFNSPLPNFPVQAVTKSHMGLLISSPQSGVDNIYLWNGNNTPRALTNSMTRTLTGQLDPLDDSLFYSEITSDGPKLYNLKKKQWQTHDSNPPQVDSLFDPPQLLGSKTKTPRRYLSQDSSLTAEEFSPWRYLYPNHWIPFLFFVDGGTIFQAMTSAGDPLGINTISMTAQWDTLTKKPGASLSYLNRSLPVSLGAAVSNFYTYFYPDDSSLNFTNASAIMAYPLPFLNNSRMTFRWNYSTLDFINRLFIRQGPQLQFSYNNTQRRANDISSRSGWRMELGHSQFLYDLSNVDYGETTAHFGTFWSSFTPKRHVVYLGLNGSYAPQLNNGLFQTSTLAGPFFNPQLINTTFLQRGYPTGVFLGRSIANANLEYRFPFVDVFRGWVTPPVFIKNIQASFVFDASTLDGQFSNAIRGGQTATEVGRFFTGYGMEFEANVTAGFFVPVAFTLGLYYGEERESFGGFTTFFNIRL